MKRMLMTAVVFAAALFCLIQTGAARVGGQEISPSDSAGLPNKIWKRGLAIAPVTLNLTGKDKVLVGEGKVELKKRSDNSRELMAPADAVELLAQD